MWDLAFPDILWTCFLGALIPLVLLRIMDRERGMGPENRRLHLWAIAAWTLASPALFVASHGRVWFTAQITATLALVMALNFGWRMRRPWLAGLCLGLALSSRPHLLFALPFFILESYRCPRPLKSLLQFAIPLGIIGVLLGIFNWLRFEDFFEFGHRYLDIRWQARMQEIGMFSWSYLPRNFEALLFLWPQFSESFPLLSNLHPRPWPTTHFTVDLP